MSVHIDTTMHLKHNRTNKYQTSIINTYIILTLKTSEIFSKYAYHVLLVLYQLSALL